MRQFFTFRFWASVLGLAVLLGVIYTQARGGSANDLVQEVRPPERRIDLITRILAAQPDAGWTVRDGITVGEAQFDTGYGGKLIVASGTQGELQCDALAVPGGCYVLADMLGDAVVWFVLLPYPPRADEASLPAIEILLDDVTTARLTNGWVLPLADRVERRCPGVDTPSLSSFVGRFGTRATTVLDVARQEIIAVACPAEEVSAD
jgi:hypothetical protein